MSHPDVIYKHNSESSFEDVVIERRYSRHYCRYRSYSSSLGGAVLQAVGCAIELATNIASGRLQNGLALVRPPGHHAEPTQPM